MNDTYLIIRQRKFAPHYFNAVLKVFEVEFFTFLYQRVNHIDLPALSDLLFHKAEHPQALVAAHPECPSDVLAMSDFIGSTSSIIDWCASQGAQEFIVMTESGVRHSLEKLAPGKKFHFIANEQCNCSECPYMKRNTLEKLRDALRDLQPRVDLSQDLMDRARVPIERMLAVR